MNKLHNLSLGRKLAIAFCALMICLSFAAGLFIPRFTNSAAETTTVHAATETGSVSGEELAYNYTAVSADLYKQGVVVYGNKTTVANLKRNLVVKGTFTDESGTHSVLLDDSAYTVSVQIDTFDAVEKSDVDFVFNDDTVPAGTTIKVYVNCNALKSEPVTIANVKNNADYPVYSSITVEKISNIENDYTVQSLRTNPSFIVKSNGTEIVNREFYEVTALNMPKALTGTGSFTVRFNGSDYNGVIEGARPATVVSASLTVKQSLIKVGDYYKIADGEGKASRYSAFVAGMTQEEILKGLDLTVYYNNSFGAVEVSVGDNGSLSSPDLQSVIWSGDINSANTSCTVSLSVTGLSNQGSATASAVIPLEAEKVVDIEIKENFETEYKTVHSPSDLPISNILSYVNVVYNNDYYNKNKTHANLQTTDLRMEGRLTPTAEVIVGGISAGQQYSKQVKLVYTGNNADTNYEISTPVTFKVAYRNLSVIALSAEEGVNQTYKSQFNYSDISVTFLSGSTLITAPISDFINADISDQLVKVTYYSDTNYNTEIVPENGIFNVGIKSIKVQFRYSKNTEWNSESGVYTLQATIQKSEDDFDSQVLYRNKFALEAPSLNVAREIYGKNPNKEFSFATDNNEEIDSDQKTIIDDIISRVNVEVKRNGQTLSNLSSADILNNRYIPISEAGTYRVSFTLGEDDTAEVRWGGVGNVTSDDADTTVIYEFTIAPTDIDLKIQFSQLSWEYGDDFSSFISVIGTLKGLNEEFYIGTGADQVDLKYRVLYYIVGGDGTGLEYPKNAGEYYVVVDTLAGGNYNEAQSAAPNQYSGAPKITVKPKQINYTTLNKEIVYDGADHTVADFIKTDGLATDDRTYILYGETKTVSYDDEISSVLDSTGMDTKYTHVTSPAPKATLKILASNKNYVWIDNTGKEIGKTTTVDIVISQRKHSVSVSNVNDYVYGETANTPSVTITANNTVDPTVVFNPTVTCIEVDSILYYAAADFSESTGKPSNAGNNLTTGSDTWAAGTYYVYVTTKLIAPANAVDSQLVTTYAKFVISRKTITKVNFTQTADVTYDGNEKTISLANWQNVVLNSATTVNISDILEIKVEGVLIDSTDMFTAGITNTNNGTIKVFHAGVYTITVSFDSDNFDWTTDGSEDVGFDEHGALTFTYTVKQATIYTLWADPDFVYNPSGEQQIPVLNCDTSKIAFAANDNLQLETKVYKGNSATGTSLTVTSKIVDGNTLYYVTGDAGTYYIALTSFTAKTEGGFDYKNDYAQNWTQDKAYEKEFIIVAAGLDKPELSVSGTTVTEEYKGSAYTINSSAYFADWSKYLYGSNSCMLEFKVVAKASSKPTYDGAQFTAVTANGGMKDAGEYIVYVYPAANFKWNEGTGAAALTGEGAPADKTGFVFTFVIEQKEIEITWTNTSLTYNGEKQQPVATASGTLYDNASDIKISVSGGQIDAGTGYEATADTLTGTRGFNYKLPADNDKKSTKYSISRYEVARPHINGASSGTFDGSNKTFNYVFATLTNLSSSYKWNNSFVTIAISGQYRDGLTTYINHNESYSFNWTTSSVVVVNAGYYTVIFSLKDTKNFVWASTGGGTVDANGILTGKEIVISRQSVTAPRLGQTVDGVFKSERTFVRDGDNDLKPTNFFWTTDFSNKAETGYGKYDSTKSGKEAYVTAEDFHTTGEYYVSFNINTTDYLNYVWVANAIDNSDPAYTGGLVSANCFTVYEEGLVCVYIHYAITGTVLEIEYTINEYDFGDNGNGNNIFADIIKNNIDFALSGWNGTKTYNQTITFKDKDDNEIGTVTIDEDKKITSSGEMLENYLPWNAGTYKLEIGLNFTDTNLQNRTFRNYTLIVNPKKITADDISFSDNNSETNYDGNVHTITAKLTSASFVPARGSGEAVAPTFTVALLNGVAEAKNAGTYTAKVNSVSDGNYELDGDIEYSFTIGKRAVKITLDTNKLTSVYGTEISFTGVTWTNADTGFIATDGTPKNFIGYKLYKNDNSEVTDYSAGDYLIKPYLLNENGNYSLADTDIGLGNYKIQQREIEVSLADETNRKAEYGATVSLDNVYTVNWTNGIGSWRVGNDDVFTISSDATTPWVTAGKYNITLTRGSNTNYTVKIGGTEISDNYTWEKSFEITPAEITATATGNTVTYKASAYSYIGDLITVSAQVKNNQNVSWHITPKVGEETTPSATAKWTNITDATLTNAEKGDYWIKAAAPNHSEKVVGSVTVEIEKKTVTVGLNIKIYYGEAKPENYDGNGAVFLGTVEKASDLNHSFYKVEGLIINDNPEISGTIAYTTDYTKGDNVDTYSLTISGVNLTSANYMFVAGNGSLQVLPLPVKVTLQNITATYNQDNPPSPETAIKAITTAQKSTYSDDSDDLIVIYGSNTDIVKVTTDALTSTTGKNTNVVKDYTITATKKSDNYSFTADSVTAATYKIIKAVNALNGGYKLFTVAPSYATLDEGSANAWVYGSYTDTQIDGYKKDGNQTAVGATFVYDEEGAEVTYTLYKGTSETSTTSSNDLAKLFSGSLGAGDYRVVITFPAGDNYGAVSDERYFRVGKRALSVTAKPLSIEYGDSAPVYTYAVTGYATTAVGVVEGIAVFGDNKPVFHSNYEVGNFVNNYDITYESGAQSLDNYTVTYTGNTLTVGKRNVTIVIEYKESYFDYYNETEGNKKAKELTFNAVDGTSFYEDKDTVIKLYTDANTAFETFKTNAAGDYPIFAVFTETKYADNYSITVKAAGVNVLYNKDYTDDSAYLSHTELAVGEGKAGTAGVYTIKPAEISLTVDDRAKYAETPTGELKSYSEDVKDPLVYDSRYKGFTATVDGMEGVTVYAVYGTSSDVSQMHREMFKEPGTYYYSFKTNNPNYKWAGEGNTTSRFKIEAKSLSVTTFVDGENEANLNVKATYKQSDFKLKFVIAGLVSDDDFGNVNASVSAVKISGTNSAFNSVDPFGTISPDINSEDKSFTFNLLNAGVYTVTISINDNNYSLNHTFSFTINRKDLNLYAANTFVQYGTPIKNNAPVLQPDKTGADNILDILAEGGNLNEYYDTYRFAGFTLNKATLDTIAKEGAGLFVKNGIAFVSDYNAATSEVSDQWYSITVKAGSVQSYNYNLLSPESSGSRLYIIQRRIDVTVKGYTTENSDYAKATYRGTAYTEIPNYKDQGLIAYFFDYDESAETGWYGVTEDNKLGIVTATSTRLYVNGGALDYKESGYPISVEQSTTNNYLVSYLNTSGKVLNGNVNDSDAPVFMVEKKALTISVVSAVTESNEFDVIYGNTTSGLYKAVYDGFVDKDGNEDGYTIPQTHTGGGITFEEIRSSSDTGSSNRYTPWTSHAGAKYTVRANNSTLWFTNYSIKYETATMTVVSRKITVETENRTYTEDGSDYHNGEYGINHIAPLIFKDVAGNHNNAAQFENYLIDSGNIYSGTVKSNTVFTLEYLVKGAWTSTAPDKAGEYSVRISLSGADFEFDTDKTNGTTKNPVIENSVKTATSVEFKYEVEKKILSIHFEEKPSDFFGWDSEVDAGVKNITVENFVSAIMSADYVQRNDQDFTTEPKDKGGYYLIGEDGFGLTIYPDGVGSYLAIINIKQSAQGNYKWIGDAPYISLSFNISSDILRVLTLEVEDWTYLEYDAEDNKINITYDQPYDEKIIFSYQYWHYIGERPAESYWNGKFDTVQGLGTPVWTSTLPTDAGIYVLRAQYTGSQFATAFAYCLFEITPKEIAKPEFDADNSEINISYNAEQRQAVIKYNSTAMDYTFAQGTNGDGVPMRSGNTITVTATNADTYVLSFTLTNTNNYVWAKEVNAVNGAVELTWTIAKAKDNKVDVQEVEIPYGESYEASAVSKYSGVITYTYAVRKNGETTPSATAQWKEVKPVNAGAYWIKAVCAGTANFEERTGSGKLTIGRVTLTATPEGSMTYGDGFVNAVKNIVYTGWKAQALTVTENVEYSVKGYDGTGVLTVKDGGYVLIADGELTVSEGTDEVYGFAVKNYDIEIVNGTFTVNKKDIEVTIENLSAIYGEEFDPSKVKLTSLAGLVGKDGDNAFEALSITPTVLGELTDGYYNASAYVLSSVGHENSANYNVTVRSGIYRVESLDVYVTVDAGGGEYGSVAPASKTGIYTKDGDKDVESIFGELNVEFRYSGTANDGTTVNNSIRVPSLAGSYTAVARLNNGNFNLVTDKGTPSAAFIVSRKTIAESDITVEELKYNGEEQSPVIADTKYSDLYTAEEVSFVNVGGYTVKLTLKDADNYRWSSVEGNEYNLPFSIGRGDNEFTSDVVIAGWSFGGNANTPSAETMFGDSSTYVYTYSTSKDGEYTRTVPTLAGTYWVKVTVPQSDNYNEKTSEPVSFTIGKRAVKAPVLEVITEGENANTVYTGARLKSAVKDYDPVLMRIIYEGDLSSTGSVAVYALNAGEYKIYVALNDESNYTWAEGIVLNDNNAQLIWTVARKKIAKPTMTSEMYMVNGGTLTFTPDGYDESTMTIKDNTTSYGGVFKVTVSIRDNVNFEWADGSAEDITFDWVVIGWDTVFIIVVSVLGVVAAISAIAIGIQYGLHKRRKKAEAVKSAAAEKAFHENVAKIAESKQTAEKPSEDNSLDEPAEQTGDESSEESKPEDKEAKDEGGNKDE